MKERPIIFSGPMVRAILGGTKTETRRIVKPQPDKRCDKVIFDPAIGWRFRYDSNRRCPYGEPGDLLYVRETWRCADGKDEGTLYYKADEPWHEDAGWKSPRYMPKSYARVWLRVLEVRVERLQEITEEGAISEGVHIMDRATLPEDSTLCRKCGRPRGAHLGQARVCPRSTGQIYSTRNYRAGFARLWDNINGKRAPWASNPLVWVIRFERTEAPR